MCLFHHLTDVIGKQFTVSKEHAQGINFATVIISVVTSVVVVSAAVGIWYLSKIKIQVK
jgi:hypothetical protein